MPKPRTPTAKAELNGQAEKHPEHFSGRKEPKVAKLGEPSTWMIDENQVKSWNAFKRELPWLGESDRTCVEIASVLRARLMSGDEVGVNALGQLRLLLNEMGATPATRSRIEMPDDEEDDIDEMLN